MKFLQLYDLLREHLENDYDNVISFLIDYFDYSSYNEFIDHQEIGDCQHISKIVEHQFPQFKSVFGSIEIDDILHDQMGEYSCLPHHYNVYKGQIFDFSKGTLKDYIRWNDLYNPIAGRDNVRYK